MNPYSFHEEGKPLRLAGSAGAHYGFALSDTGNAHGAEIFHLGLAFRGPRFGLGWNPYVAFAKVSHEGTGGFGHHLWGALHFGGGSHWRFSAQLSLAAMTKVNEDKGCDTDGGLLFGGCTGKPESSSRVQTRVFDHGLTLTAERRVSERGSLLFAPAIYYTRASSGNQLDLDPAGNLAFRTHFWSPGLQLGYVGRWGEDERYTLALLAGAQLVKTFQPGRVVHELLPSGGLRFLF